MRLVDLSRNNIIKAGIPWAFSGSPNSKNMIEHLERNESVITWMEPVGGSISQQFPAIRIHDQYYTLSLRQMKAVWRHVRLKKNFVNREVIPHVGTKLRIPEILLVEKLRTQQRFNVSPSCQCSHGIILTFPAPAGDARIGIRARAQGRGAEAD